MKAVKSRRVSRSEARSPAHPPAMERILSDPAAAGLITGSFIIETIFDIPGLGRFFIQSVFNLDYPLIMGTVLFYATLVILFNLLVDVIQVFLNPKLRFE